MIYFVRHGETVWNTENKVCGATDSPLTERGHQQAVETAKKIQDMHIKVDIILYSPLSRAKETARHISEICGVPMREEKRLFEQSFGRLESRPKDSSEFNEAKKQFLLRYEGGESMFHVAQRVYNLLDELKAEGKNYLLVAHNGIARFVQSYFFEMTNDEYADFAIKNCEVKEYRL